MNNDQYLKHYGIVGMRWGKGNNISTIVKRNEKMTKTVGKLTKKQDKNKLKIDKLTNKLKKQGNYWTTIGYTMSQNTGRKLGKTLAKDVRLQKKIDKIKSRIEKNTTLMSTKIKDVKTN